MKKRQRKIRLIRAGIQLLFFIFAPALFSTAFAGVKSVFQAIAGGDCAADSAHDRNVHSGKIFLPVPLPNGRNFCYNAYSALCAVQP